MAELNSKKAAVDAHNSKTAIGNFNGRLDYPSSKGLGVDLIHYERRNPHPTERNPLPAQLKMRDLPHWMVRDLKDSARAGELRGELHRQIDLLEKNHYADKGTIAVLRDCEHDLTGVRDCDSDQLDGILAVVQTLGPAEVKP